MTTRYVTAAPAPTAREWWETNAADHLARTVYEPESPSRDTGLVDARGAKLYRVEVRDPIGFRRPKT